MSDAFLIRPACSRDFPQVAELEAELFRLHFAHRPDLFDPAYAYSPREFDALLADPNAIALVAQQNGTVIGLCFGQVSDDSHNPVVLPSQVAHLEDLIVDPAFRGRGVASALLREARARAKAFGAQYLRLHVWHFNPSAMSLYQSLGFQPQWSLMEEKL